MNDMTHKIENEVELTRSHLDQTLDSLRHKLSPGQLIDETVKYARHTGAGEMLTNLGGQARANPIPLALVGIGLAWLMSGRGHPSTHSNRQDDSDETSFGDRMSQSTSRLANKAEAHTRETAAKARRSFGSLLESEPLVIAALGVGIGAAIGAALPPTETEDEHLGDERDRITSEFTEHAQEELSKTKAAFERSNT